MDAQHFNSVPVHHFVRADLFVFASGVDLFTGSLRVFSFHDCEHFHCQEGAPLFEGVYEGSGQAHQTHERSLQQHQTHQVVLPRAVFPKENHRHPKSGAQLAQIAFFPEHFHDGQLQHWPGRFFTDYFRHLFGRRLPIDRRKNLHHNFNFQ